MAIQLADPSALDHDTLEEGGILAPRFDAHGLVTAIAADNTTNSVLMLAHMNAEALRLTLETNEVHYFSRSRNKIWKKGETSGEIQRLVEIRVDCDQDALLLVVEQTGRGAACHTGRKTCFFRKVVINDDKASLTDTGEKVLFDPKKVYS